jgi:hypothetical protein
MNKMYWVISALVVFTACNQPEQKEDTNETTTQPNINYEGVSVVIMEDAKKTLGGELKAAMERGGVAEAVNYCNLNASGISETVGKKYNATIKRVTDKPRNPANAAIAQELAQLENWRGILAANTGQVVTKEETETERHFYMPIKIDAFCTSCHGVVGETLTVENQAIIAAKYPEDKATGYQAGDLRGLWHITFPK